MSVGEIKTEKRGRGRPPTGIDPAVPVRLRKTEFDEVSKIAKDRNMLITDVLSSLVRNAIYDSKIAPG